MIRASARFRELSGTWPLSLVALALLLRIMIPAGFMPAAGQGFAITLCTGMGTAAAWVDSDGNVHKDQPVDPRSDRPCTFAGFGAVLDLPAIETMPVPAATRVVVHAILMTAVAIGRGLAAPPPPPTGPPASP